MRGIIRLAVPLVVLMFLLAGCAKRPDQEIAAADNVLKNARAAEAETYAPKALATAEKARAELDAELKAQEDKFALLRSYGKAVEIAGRAKTEAEKAAVAAKKGKEQTGKEVSELAPQAKLALQEARAMLKKAPRGKVSKSDAKAFEAELAQAELSLSLADSAMAGGHHMKAKKALQASIDTIQKVKAAVEGKRS